MGQLSMATRKELTAAVSERYRASTRAEKARILDEFVVITGFHRKHAMRLLRRHERAPTGRRARPRIYDEAERNALILLWEASGARINWMFSTEQARLKMAKTYPKPTAKES
jgi:hypothetical protein